MMNGNQMAMAMRQQMTQNPQLFAQNALRSGMFNRNPVYKNALEAVANGDTEKVKDFTQNLCRENHVSVDDAMEQYKKQYGLN